MDGWMDTHHFSVEPNTIYLNLLKKKYTSATVYPTRFIISMHETTKVVSAPKDKMHCEPDKSETN